MTSSFMTGLPESPDAEEEAIGRNRALSGASTGSRLKEEDDEDRVDARNAASRLATSTF
jgi:hypothetical protein